MNTSKVVHGAKRRQELFPSGVYGSSELRPRFTCAPAVHFQGRAWLLYLTQTSPDDVVIAAGQLFRTLKQRAIGVVE